jgi:hypothetical protein
MIETKRIYLTYLKQNDFKFANTQILKKYKLYLFI